MIHVYERGIHVRLSWGSFSRPLTIKPYHQDCIGISFHAPPIPQHYALLAAPGIIKCNYSFWGGGTGWGWGGGVYSRGSPGARVGYFILLSTISIASALAPIVTQPLYSVELVPAVFPNNGFLMCDSFTRTIPEDHFGGMCVCTGALWGGCYPGG